PLSQGRCAARPDVARKPAHARGVAAGAAFPDRKYPGLLGQARARGRGRLPRRGRQRSGRHAHEREHLARRGQRARRGIADRTHARAHTRPWPERGAAHDALSQGRCRAAPEQLRGARAPADRTDPSCCARMTVEPRTIAVIGGTGAEGRGLALRWAAAGHHVIVGSRDAMRAQAAAKEIAAKLPSARIEGAVSLDAAQKAGIVVLAVPYAVQLETV